MSFIIWKYSVMKLDLMRSKRSGKSFNRQKNRCILWLPSFKTRKDHGIDNPENPTIMEDFIRALGAEPVVYPYRNECCGGYISLKEKEMSQNMCEKIMDSAKGFEADMLITACPLCMYNLKRTEPAIFLFTILQNFLQKLSE